MHYELRYPLKLILGEGIHWSTIGGTQGHFLCVDIHGRKIVRLSLDTGSIDPTVWEAPERVGWVFPTEERDVVVAGFQSGVVWLELGSEISVRRRLPLFPGLPEMRLNDAMIDPRGVLWTGSLNCDDESQSVGALYRIGGAADVRIVDSGYCVTNGPALSTDGSLFLHTDSARRTIYAFDFDDEASEISNRRVWKIFEEAEGYPDGMTFDSDNNVWIAHWGSGLVSQFDLYGKLLQRIKLPVSNVTNLAFGGSGRNRLFVTTASCGLTDAQRKTEPFAGGIFEIAGHGARGA